jgi:pimeloyl-ACP methyl ester carboxylesterase
MNRRAFGLGALAVAGCATAGESLRDGPIDEGAWLSINGVEQWIAIRGRSKRNPVLLFLHGGPGAGVAGSMPLFEAWTEDFTVVLWDQPGSGATGARRLGNQGPLTVDRYTCDGIAVAEHVRARFGKRKIVLMGISWGSRLGLHLVKRRPDLFSVYVGTAQPVGRRGDVMGYEMALKGVRARGNAAGITALERVGPPPYPKFEDFLTRQQYTNPPGQPMSALEQAKTAVANRLRAIPQRDAAYLAYKTPPAGFNEFGLFMETLRAVYSEWHWEIRDFGRDWPIPIFVFQGENDLNAPEPLAREWVAEIRAPKKAYETIRGAGHNTMLFHDELLALLRKHVVSLAA